MCMSTHYVENIVPKKYTRDYVNKCCTDGKSDPHTNCSNVNDYSKN